MSEQQKSAYTIGSWILLLAVVGALFIVNFFSDKVFTRLDLTENDQYTLSQSTKTILAELPDPVTITGYFSSNIPSPWNRFVYEVEDLLHEYEVYGDGNVELKMVDPTGNPEVQTELARLGITSATVPVRGVDQVSTLQIYAHILVTYRKETHVLPYVLSTETLEYDLTTAIARMVSGEDVIVGFFNPDQGREIFEEFKRLKEALESQFEVEEVDGSGAAAISPDIDVLIVPTPNHVSDRGLFELDQYVMGGGDAIFLADGARVFLQPGQLGIPMPFFAMAMSPEMDNLGRLLTHYGVTREYNLVQDKPFVEYPILGPLAGRKYPLFPHIDMNSEDQTEHPITQGIDYLDFTWASSLKVGTLPDAVNAIELVQTSPGSWVQAGQQLMVDPMSEPVPPMPIPGMGREQRTLAVLLTGQFNSMFAGQPAPPMETMQGDTIAAAEPEQRLDQSEQTNILVIGCSTFVSEQSPISITSNVNFIVSAVEWMAGGYALSDINKRRIEPRPIQDLNLTKVILLGVIAPLLAPVVVIGFGVFRFVYMSQKKKRFLESV